MIIDRWENTREIKRLELNADRFCFGNAGHNCGHGNAAINAEINYSQEEKMAETQGNNGSEENQNKTFTQEEVNSIIGERLARQAEKYFDYDELKNKAAEYDKAQEASKTELQKTQEANAKLQAKIEGMEKEKKLLDTRSKVAKEKGVPADLLTGEDEDTCKAQADAILKFAKGPKYPGIKESKHEMNQNSTSNTNNDFRELAGQIFGRKD